MNLDDLTQDQKNQLLERLLSSIDPSNQTIPLIKKVNKKSKPKIERPDLFIERGFDKEHKEDIKLDKKLWGDNKPSERKNVSSLVEIACRRCHALSQVSPQLITRDDEGNRYVCNKCSKMQGS